MPREAPLAETAAPAKGTRPEGAVSEADASSKVRDMFTQIAPRYDLLNHLLSLQLDRLWRARTTKHLRSLFPEPEIAAESHKPVYVLHESFVLDLCCGTGDLAIALNLGHLARVTGVDFAHSMLIRAKKKSARLHSKTLA